MFFPLSLHAPLRTPNRHLYDNALRMSSVLVYGLRMALPHFSAFPQRLLCISEISLPDVSDMQIILNKVLLVSTRDKAYIGMPVVTNAAVHAVVEEQVCPMHVV
jgi:hypothetical protein